MSVPFPSQASRDNFYSMAKKTNQSPLSPPYSFLSFNRSKPVQDENPNWRKPTSLTTSFSAGCFVYTLALIAALEYCFRTFPAADSRRAIPNGTGSEVYGPFNSAPLARIAAITPAITTTLPSQLAVNTSTNPPTIHETPLNQSPTPTTTHPTSSAIQAPDNWEDAYLEAVTFGVRPGIPGFGLNITTGDNSTETNLTRRVPPPDQWGQLPGRVQYVQFDVLGFRDRISSDWTILTYIEYFYLPKDQSESSNKFYLSISDDPQYCPIVCNGPALVFLKLYCWDSWKNKASLYSRRVRETPRATTAQSEDRWKDGTPCPSVTADMGITPSNSPIPVTIGAGFGVGGTTSEVARPTGEPSQPTDNSVTEQWILTTVVQRDAQGNPTVTATTRLRATQMTMTLTDLHGLPTATVTTNVLLAPSVLSFKGGSDGAMTTISTIIPLVAGSIVVTDSNGIPIATITGYVDADGPAPTAPTRTGGYTGGWSGDNLIGPDLHPVSRGDYILASFAPILLALPLAILVQIQSASLKDLLPFYALSKTANPAGVTAARSLCMTTGGLQGFVIGMELLFNARDPLMFLADLHVLASSLVVSFSSEALGIKLYGHCRSDDFRGCHMGVAVFRSPGRIVQVFLAITLVINLLINGVLLRRAAWRRTLDIYTRQGRSISATGSLLANSSEYTRGYFRNVGNGLPNRLIRNRELKRYFDGYLFAIRPSAAGLELSQPDLSKQPSPGYYLTATPLPGDVVSEKDRPVKSSYSGSQHSRPFQTIASLYQDIFNQLAFLLAIIGFLILLLYYELTSTNSPFERFMNSQGIGVRALFTSLGIIISLFWDTYFSQLATQSPYRQLSQLHPSPPFPTTAFSVLCNPRSLLAGNHQPLVVITAATTALSKITPLLLSNVPFSPWLTWSTHQGCAWSSIGILGLMVVVLVYGMVVTQGHRRAMVRVPKSEVDLATLGGRILFYGAYLGECL